MNSDFYLKTLEHDMADSKTDAHPFALTPQSRKDNLELSNLRDRNIPILSPVKGNTKKRKDGSTNDEVKAHTDQHVQRFCASQHTSSFVEAIMACHRNSQATWWEQHMSIFFFVNHIIEVDPFCWFQTAKNKELSTTDQSCFLTNNWQVPVTRGVPEVMKVVMRECHPTIEKSGM